MNVIENYPTQAVNQLLHSLPFLNEITNDEEYEAALALTESLFENYEQNRFMVDLLAIRIQEWESNANEFKSFNEKLAKQNQGVALLNTLVEQYQIKLDDLKEEIGGKSLVSQVLSGKRSLTKQHIEKLAARFYLSPAAFFE